MKTTSYETWCPLFSGFYGTIWEGMLDSAEEMEKERLNECRIDMGRRELTDREMWDCEFDYDDARKEICSDFVSLIEDELSGIAKSFKMQSISSPREYNFSNDSINVEVELIDGALSKWLENEEWMKFMRKRIYDKYSSCSGFISNHSQHWKDWLEETDNLTDFDCDGHKLGAILEGILRFNKVSEDYLYDGVEYPCLTMDNWDEMLELARGCECGYNPREIYESECKKAKATFGDKYKLYTFEQWFEKNTICPECGAELNYEDV